MRPKAAPQQTRPAPSAIDDMLPGSSTNEPTCGCRWRWHEASGVCSIETTCGVDAICTILIKSVYFLFWGNIYLCESRTYLIVENVVYRTWHSPLEKMWYILHGKNTEYCSWQEKCGIYSVAKFWYILDHQNVVYTPSSIFGIYSILKPWYILLRQILVYTSSPKHGIYTIRKNVVYTPLQGSGIHKVEMHVIFFNTCKLINYTLLQINFPWRYVYVHNKNNTTTRTPLQQRTNLYLNAHISVADTRTNGFTMRCVFGRCYCIMQHISLRW